MSRNDNQAILSEQEYADTIDCLSRMKVPQVKDIARCLSLPLSGKKQDLINRVVSYCEQGKRLNDNILLLAVRTIVLKVRNNDPIPNFTALYDALRTGAYNFVEGISQYSNYKNEIRGSSQGKNSGNESYPYKGHVLYFKESPFYNLKRLVHGSPQIAIPSKMKAICRYQFVLNDEESNLFNLGDKKVKLYLLCGVSNNSSASTSSALLQFPIPIEIHVNGTHIKENVRGIKGKPGTARPANITEYILLNPQTNKIEMAYAGTTESFLLYLYIVETISCEQLIEQVVQQPHLHANSTISDIKKEYTNDAGDDDDIIVSTSSISLKCPLTYARMKYPTKSIFCQHIQCFDGLSYLQLQEQVPSWICPICSIKIDITHLAISDYYCDALSKTSSEVENVTINEDGTWTPIKESSHSNDNGYNGNNNNSDTSASGSVKQEPHAGILDNQLSSVQPETIEIISLDSESEDDSVIEQSLNNASNTNNVKESDLPNINTLNGADKEPPIHVSSSENTPNVCENQPNPRLNMKESSTLFASNVSSNSSSEPQLIPGAVQSVYRHHLPEAEIPFVKPLTDPQPHTHLTREIHRPISLGQPNPSITHSSVNSDTLSGGRTDLGPTSSGSYPPPRVHQNNGNQASSTSPELSQNYSEPNNSIQKPGQRLPLPFLNNSTANVNPQLFSFQIPGRTSYNNIQDYHQNNTGYPTYPETFRGSIDAQERRRLLQGQQQRNHLQYQQQLQQKLQLHLQLQRGLSRGISLSHGHQNGPSNESVNDNSNLHANHNLTHSDHTFTSPPLLNENILPRIVERRPSRSASFQLDQYSIPRVPDVPDSNEYTDIGQNPNRLSESIHNISNESTSVNTDMQQDGQNGEEITAPTHELNRMRYSQSAFDLVNKNLQNDDASREELGNTESSDSIVNDGTTSVTPFVGTEFTPLKGKIDSMQLGTVSDKKRTSSGTGRTWNKRMNNSDSNMYHPASIDKTPSKPSSDTREPY